MKTRIRKITVVTNPGVCVYEIGDIVNGLEVDKIENNTLESPGEIDFIFHGLTKDDVIVFELINVPMAIEYEEDTE